MATGATMATLAEIQKAFRQAMLTGGPHTAALVETIAGDAPGAAARLRIYRHHVLDTLTDVLAQAFPVVRRLVGPGFFAYAADAFVRRHPPATPCLFEYGDRLPDFLAEFPACRHLVYLADVARLEWAMQAAMHSAEASPLAPTALAAVPVDAIGRAVLRLDASLALIQSAWPVDRIWQANQPDADPEASVDLTAGPARVEIRRLGDDVVFRFLDPGVFAFRRALREGRRLDRAAETALTADPEFDLTRALRALFDEELPVGLAIEPDDDATSGPPARDAREAPPQEGSPR